MSNIVNFLNPGVSVFLYMCYYATKNSARLSTRFFPRFSNIAHLLT